MFLSLIRLNKLLLLSGPEQDAPVILSEKCLKFKMSKVGKAKNIEMIHQDTKTQKKPQLIKILFGFKVLLCALVPLW